MNLNFTNPEQDLLSASFTTEAPLLDVVIHTQQRNGKKAWTIVTGLEEITNFDVKKKVKMLKKRLSCNACVKRDKDSNQLVVSFQGRHAELIRSYLKERWKLSDDEITMKGC